MKNKKHIQNEIIKLRKVVKIAPTEFQKHAAWCSMLTLQWVLQNKKSPITPTCIVMPTLNPKSLK